MVRLSTLPRLTFGSRLSMLLWLTWVSVATAIPLITVDIHFMLTQFNQRRLRVSRVAGLHS